MCGDMSIRYWHPSDEELKGLSGVAITDEDGGFVVGTMKCFAGLALASTLAANAVAAQLPVGKQWQVDERVVPGTIQVDDSGFIPPVPQTPAVAWAAVTIFDEDPSFAPATQPTASDDGQWIFTIPRAVVVSTVIADDSDFIPVAPAQDDPWPIFTPRPPAVVTALTDDDQYIGYLGVNEEPWIPGIPKPPLLVTAIIDDSDFVQAGQGAAALDDSQWTVTPPRPSTIVTAVTDDSDYIPQSTAPEDGIWIVTTDVQPVVRAFTDDSDFVAPAVTPIPSEDYWRVWVPTTIQAVVLIFDDDSDYATPPVVTLVEEGQWSAPALSTSPAFRLVFTTDGDFTSVTVDEPGSWPQPKGVPATPVLPIVDDGNFGPTIGNIAAEAYEWKVPRAPLAIRVVWAFTNDDVAGFVTNFPLPPTVYLVYIPFDINLVMADQDIHLVEVRQDIHLTDTES